MTGDRDGSNAPGFGAHTRSPAAPGDAGQGGGEAVVGVEEMLPLAIPELARRGRGRPNGSPNIRTNLTFQAAVSRYGDPLIASIAWGNMPTGELITHLRKLASDCGLKLGATVMDVVRFQEECRRNAMPFGHAKRAPEDHKGDPVLPIIGIGTLAMQVNVAASAPGRSIEEALDNQGVTDVEPDKSHDGKSHDDASD